MLDSVGKAPMATVGKIEFFKLYKQLVSLLSSYEFVQVIAVAEGPELVEERVHTDPVQAAVTEPAMLKEIFTKVALANETAYVVPRVAYL